MDEVLSEPFASDNNLESFLKHPKTKESVKIDERRFFSSEEGEKIETGTLFSRGLYHFRY